MAQQVPDPGPLVLGIGPAELLRSGILDQAPESGPTPAIADQPSERVPEAEHP